MASMKEYLHDVEDLIVDAIESGAETEWDVLDYVNQRAFLKVDYDTVLSLMDYMNFTDFSNYMENPQ